MDQGSAIFDLLIKLTFHSRSRLARPLLACLLLFGLAFTQREILTAPLRVRHAPGPGLLERPALAFLLLNCLIATIIASSKLGIYAEEESQEPESMFGYCHGEEDDFVADTSAVEEKSPYWYTGVPLQISGYDRLCGELSLGRKWSVEANYGNNTMFDQQAKVKFYMTDQEKPNVVRKARVVSGRNDHPSIKALRNDLRKQQHTNRGSLNVHCHAVSPVSQTTMADCPSTPPERPPAEAPTKAHPSMQEVYCAAIVTSNQACELPQPTKLFLHSSTSTYFDRATRRLPLPPAPAAATLDPPPPPLHLSRWQLAAPAAIMAHPPKATKAAPNQRGGEPSRPHPAAAAERDLEGEETGGDQLEEVNRRAEEFIARFHHQMRLQREESLQHQKQGPRSCSNDVQYSECAALPCDEVDILCH